MGKPVDQRGKLGENPFEWQVTKDGRVMVTWQGKAIKTLTGKAADKVLAAIDAGDEGEVQLALAKATGNFKRGNERMGKR